MIGISNGGTPDQLSYLHSSFFDPIDEDGSDTELLGDESKSPKRRTGTIFDATDHGFDTFETTEVVERKPTAIKKTAETKNKFLLEYTDTGRRIELLTRTYEPSDFDKDAMTFSHPSDFDLETLTFKREGRSGPKDPRPQWIPKAANDNHTRKHSFPALDEARNNQLMIGRSRAEKLIQNEYAFDILLEMHDLMEAASPPSAWCQHNGHGAADEHELGDDSNPGYGVDVKHDYGPSVRKVKCLWESGNDNQPSRDGEPWNPGIVELMDVVSEPTKTTVKALRKVGGLENNAFNHITHFRDGKGNYLKFKTKTRGAKGKRAHPKVIPDPIDTPGYQGAALPRNKKGELAAGFFAGKTGSSNSVKPDTLDFEPTEAPSNSFSDPWAATIAREKAREHASMKLSQYCLLVGDKPYEALTQAASGFRIGELCGGRLGNTTDSARNRNLLQIAIERIIDDRNRSLERSKRAA